MKKIIALAIIATFTCTTLFAQKTNSESKVETKIANKNIEEFLNAEGADMKSFAMKKFKRNEAQEKQFYSDILNSDLSYELKKTALYHLYGDPEYTKHLDLLTRKSIIIDLKKKSN